MAVQTTAPARTFAPARAAVGRRRGPRPATLRNVFIYAGLIGLALLYSIPFAWLVLTSLKTPANVFSPNWIPDPIHFENYVDVFRYAPVLTWLRNSFIVAILAVAAVILSSSLVAFGFARLRFRGRNQIFALVLATYMIPGAATMVPTFLIWNELGAVNTFFPLWAGNLFASAFYVFMLRQFMLSIPQDLVDAARVDGASYFRIWWNIMLPLVKPALMAVGVFEFQTKWNDFMQPLIYINDTDLYTMALGLGLFKGQYETQWALWMAASVVFTLPMVVIFFIAQRYFIEGLSAAAVKG